MARIPTLDDDGKLRARFVPDPLTVGTEEPLDHGYTSGAQSGPAAFSVYGGGVSFLSAEFDHRIWRHTTDNPAVYGENVLSIRNLAPHSDSAVKFLGADGRERGAVGYHNDDNDNGLSFYKAAFLESSAQITADGSFEPSVPLTPLRLITTGADPSGTFGQFPRLCSEPDGRVVVPAWSATRTVALGSPVFAVHQREGHIHLGAAGTPPTGNPAAGVYLYVDGTTVKLRLPNGTVQTVQTS